MPAKYFICPNKEQIEIDHCLEQCLSEKGRCLSLPTLYSIGEQREWTGTPSTTQLIKGTRQAYLEITESYAINPKDMAFTLLGTRHHQRLEVIAKKLKMIAEKKLTGAVTGIIDLLEPDELNNGYFKLTDYKTWGSYAVAKALGLKGNKNGDPDMLETELQQNHYRLKLEALGFPISRMQIQATVRDGGTFSARNNGIEDKILVIPIKFMDNNYIQDYFDTKRQNLLQALEDNSLPSMCGWEERWGNRKCLGFCDVVRFCPEGAKMKKGGG